jgi:hypothetical protein
MGALPIAGAYGGGVKTGGRGVEVPSSAEEFGCPEDTYTGLGSVLKKAVYQQVTSEELALLALWEAGRVCGRPRWDEFVIRATQQSPLARGA